MAKAWGVLPADVRERVTVADWAAMAAVLEEQSEQAKQRRR